MLKKWIIEILGGYSTSSDALDALCLVGATEEESELARKNIIHKLGGYATIYEAINAIREENIKERNVILTMAVKKLFNTIGPEDILQPVAGGHWLLQGKPLSKGQIELLIHEAAQLEHMLLWKVLQLDINYKVNKKLYTLSENDMHVVTAKFWAYTFDVIKTRLKSIAAGSALYNKGKD